MKFPVAVVLIWALSACTSSHHLPVLVAPGAELTLISGQFAFTEGPASDRDGNVFFTDQPDDKIYKWSPDGGVTLYMDSSGRSNGLYVDDAGNLLACADLNNELWKINSNKRIAVLVKSYHGEKLNGPNDLWLAPDGGIYFTDPFYLRNYWSDTVMRQSAKRLFYLAPGDSVPQVMDSSFVQPNGLIGTPDGYLYVADIHGQKIYRYRIGVKGNLTDKRVFLDGKGSDGMTVDNQGNVYITGDGVTVYNPDGQEMLHIPVPEKWTANVTFGGKDQQTLFITASHSVYTLQMKVHGVRWPE